jgi:hypothetical protein
MEIFFERNLVRGLAWTPQGHLHQRAGLISTFGQHQITLALSGRLSPGLQSISTLLGGFLTQSLSSARCLKVLGFKILTSLAPSGMLPAGIVWWAAWISGFSQLAVCASGTLGLPRSLWRVVVGWAVRNCHTQTGQAAGPSTGSGKWQFVVGERIKCDSGFTGCYVACM